MGKLAVESRKNFPILQNKIQLSSCSQSALHIDVKQAINDYVNIWEKDGADWEEWMNVCESARNKFAKMINAKPTEIAMVSSVSHAISSILNSLPLNKDKKDFLLSENEFPTIGHVALSHREDTNVAFSKPTLEEYQKKISNKTLLTSVPHVSFYNGEISDIESIIDLAHSHNSYAFIDAYQSAGQIDIDVKKLDVDFLVSGLQKYLLGIPGIAFLYIKEEVAESLVPKITGWFGQEDPFAFNLKSVNYAKGARRFDSGTFPMLNGYAADAALKILLDIGIKNIESYLQELSQFAIDYSLENDLKLASPHVPHKKGSNTAIKVKKSGELESALHKEGIIMSSRNDVIRISPHFYNTKDDIKTGIDTIIKILNTM